MILVPFLVLVLVVALFYLRLYWKLHHGQQYPGDLQRLMAAAALDREGPARFRLGLAHLHGRTGLPKDEGSARFHLQEAAALGHVPAMVELAGMLRYGVGGPIDRPGSEAWLRQAALLGDSHRART